jgi:DNA-directed RNA polymerase specialized sigma24 family protein
MNKNYLSNKDLHCELLVSLAQGKLTRPAQKMITLICRGVNRKFSYYDNDDRYDALQEAYYTCFKNWYSYNPEKTTNAFAYVTEIAKRAHTKGWKEVSKGRDKTLSINGLYEDGSDLII